MRPWIFTGRVVRQRLAQFRRSMWFIPMLMSVGALGLFLLTSRIDQHLGGDLRPQALSEWERLLIFSGGPESAQTQLSTISGMWATIIGISFSVTLVTVQLTATKYIAQVLPLFERNKTNQVVLGTYLLTVTYAMLVARTVRAQEPAFVPYVGINVAMLLAVVSIFLLILFVSNVVNFVRPQFFLGKTLRDAHLALRKRRHGFEPAVWAPDASESRPTEPPAGARCVRTRRHGILSEVAWVELAEAARRYLVRARPGTWQVLFTRVPGDAVLEDDALAYVVAPEGADASHLAALVGWACDVRSEAQLHENPESAIEALAGLTTKGAVQGDLDVTFAGVDCLFSLLPSLARMPPPPVCLRLEVDDRVLVVRTPRQDLLAKLIRELTVISEVALAPSLPFRIVTEGISARFVSALKELAREGDGRAFDRVLGEIGAWYQSAFFHMSWVNGMYHLADDLADLATWARAEGPPGSAEAVLALLRDNRNRLAPDAPAREAIDSALAYIARAAGGQVGGLRESSEPAN